MRSFLTISVVSALTLSGLFMGAPAQALLPGGGAAQTAPSSFADLSERLLPSVVNISSTQKAITAQNFPEMPHFPPGSPFQDFFEEFMGRRGEGLQMPPQSSLGSGFIIDADKGYIVTNYHVIKDADSIRITLHDDTTIDATIVGHDEKTDLALLQVKTDKKLHAVAFGDSDKMRVGDWILAIGNPFGLGGTVTAGIVSARQRDIQSGPYDDYIQTDASINRGNSGGPMFDLNGTVIGINTAIFSPSGGSVGIGFAIPSALAKPIIAQLIEYGHTRRGWLGVRIQNVTEEIAESLGLKEASGALIASVTATGPAEKAGLQTGDVILEFDGKPINAMRTLPRAVAETPIGKKIKLVYWRGNKRAETSVEIGELEQAEKTGLISTGAEEPNAAQGQTGKSIDSVGMTLSTISSADREQYQIAADVTGLLVTNVAPENEAAEKGLLPGDVIVEINQRAVTTVDEAADLIDKAAKAGRGPILLLVHRGGDVRFIALRLNRAKTKE